MDDHRLLIIVGDGKKDDTGILLRANRVDEHIVMSLSRCINVNPESKEDHDGYSFDVVKNADIRCTEDQLSALASWEANEIVEALHNSVSELIPFAPPQMVSLCIVDLIMMALRIKSDG